MLHYNIENLKKYIFFYYCVKFQLQLSATCWIIPILKLIFDHFLDEFLPFPRFENHKRKIFDIFFSSKNTKLSKNWLNPCFLFQNWLLLSLYIIIFRFKKIWYIWKKIYFFGLSIIFSSIWCSADQCATVCPVQFECT